MSTREADRIELLQGSLADRLIGRRWIAAITLAAAALAATWLPAVRAARVDPLVALRYE